ncbi:FixH family protein [Donghicola sp. C2-DW-16]|uniref:FixH family protein n=1 Tax=Donghicola mangrovi TaxID=2729614 RepID=A0A850Q2T9_9RHOB|nr:FixH family protein [Donghicola mangrovi]NVO22282.1 FixH family protein [Donghicola mangrovi]NVO26127.1 FixH family protein [Donghicola mangrovi]
MAHAAKQEFRIKGWHVFAGFVAAFSVIITVNVLMAYKAIHTFPGLETANSYVASQTFDADRKAQLALGWDVTARVERGNLILSIRDPQGNPVNPAIEEAILGRATEAKDDRTPVFAFTGTDLSAPVDLAPGNWNLRLKARAENGTLFQQRIVLHVKG